MNDRWEEQKEKLISLRSEYDALFRHFHFMQGLRFAALAAMMPILGTLFNYYRTALPFSQFRALKQGVIGNMDPFAAIIVAAIGLGVFFALRSIEFGIGLQTHAIVDRGAEIEMQLHIPLGVFTALQRRVNLRPLHRITGIIRWGYRFGISASIILMSVGIWAALR